MKRKGALLHLLFLSMIMLVVNVNCKTTITVNEKHPDEKNVKWVVKPQFDDISYFREGLAKVNKDGKWGFINKEGEIVIPPQFDEAVDFSEGLARVEKDGKWGIIAHPTLFPGKKAK